jgi:HK97 family phage prohead protease
VTFTPVNDNLYRGLADGVALEQRDMTDDGDLGGTGTPNLAGTVMSGHFAVWDEWTEICSWYEGEFLEKLVRGSFTKTISENLARVRVQYDHGQDDVVGGAPLGPVDVLREDDIGTYYEVPLYDTDTNRGVVLPLLQGRLMSGEMRGSGLGASFRFRVLRDEWVMEPAPSAYNPKSLPERTIREVQLMEFGPVVFPAYPAATAGMRSLTDHYLDRKREKRAASMAPADRFPVTPPSGHLTVPADRDPRRHKNLATLQALRAS